MEVEYIKGLGCPVNIIWGKEAKAITIDDAKQLQAKLAQVIEQAEKESELSEFEKACMRLYNEGCDDGLSGDKLSNESLKESASELLDLARKELEGDLKEKVIHDYWKQASDQCAQARKDGKAEALKDLPRWREWGKGAAGNSDGHPIALVSGAGGIRFVSVLGITGEKYIMLDDLKKLPGFKED